jgi:hypothetical protein
MPPKPPQLPDGSMPMPVCQRALDEIELCRRDSIRDSDDVDRLDGRALYTQLKVAASLALLDERTDVTDDDWRLAGILRLVSDATRRRVQRAVGQEREHTNIGRAHSEADRDAVVEGRRDARAVERVRLRLLRLLREHGDAITRADLRKQVASRDRNHFDDAIDSLVRDGLAERRRIGGQGQPGEEYGAL